MDNKMSKKKKKKSDLLYRPNMNRDRWILLYYVQYDKYEYFMQIQLYY